MQFCGVIVASKYKFQNNDQNSNVEKTVRITNPKKE